MSIDSRSFREGIADLIKKNVDTYRINIDRITSDFRGEKGLTEAYNGRQLLELLQNADDARTDKVLISIDKENSVLSIANNGAPFDLKGVRSLMLANTSSKNKKEFIGNKGLGFRSILNWVTEVRIKTQGITLVFSPEIAAKNFNLLVPHNLKSALIANEKDLVQDEVPFAVLAIPEVKDNRHHSGWTTVIELQYRKGYEEEILSQLNEIKPETLLFLNSIQSLSVEGAGEFDKKLEKTVEGTDIKVNGIQWSIFDSGDRRIDKESDKFYRFKIAWREDLSDIDSRFFTYFPTLVPTHLPYLIHATFDLDPSRNYLNKTEDNKFILKEIARKIAELSISEFQNTETSSWKSFQFLTATGVSEYDLLKGFFSNLLLYRNTWAVYPCLDNSYRTQEDVVFYNSRFSAFIAREDYGATFNELLLAPTGGIENEIKALQFKKYTPDKLYFKLTEISENINSHTIRAELLTLLLDATFKSDLNLKYPLLINDDLRVIRENTTAFTPIMESEKILSRPAYLSFDFINKELYGILIKLHKAGFDKSEPDSREFQRLFKELVNIQPYDSNNVISRIIAGTRRELNTKPDIDHPLIVKEMVQCIFQNYKLLNDKKETFSESFPLLSVGNVVTESNDLYLGATYPTGEIVEDLYSGILGSESYLREIDFWGLPSNDPPYLESFFLWMGVNRLCKLRKVKFVDLYRTADNDFKNFAIRKVGEKDKVTYYSFDGLKIEDFETTVSKLSIEKLLVLIKKEEKIFVRLGPSNPDKLSYKYGNSYYQNFPDSPSYLNFQFSTLKVFNHYIIEDYGIPFLNSFAFENYKLYFEKHEINEDEIRYILTKLGAKSKFSDLGLRNIFNLLNKCAEEKASDSLARKLYQLSFNHFRKLRNPNSDFEVYHFDLKLLAVKNGEKKYQYAQEVYYSDNATLPSNILNDYWIFDFPKRSGEKQLASYFGVKTFKEINIEVLEAESINSKAKNEFENWFNKIKPYLLAYRLNGESIERTAASALRNVTIQLVEKAIYRVDRREPKELLAGEFLNLGNNSFLLCAPTAATINFLKEDPSFCEAFAEILCVLFEVNEGKDDYRSVFKDRDDLKDTKYLIRTKTLDDKLDTAFKLLGLSNEESRFWNVVFALSGNELTEPLSSHEMLNRRLSEIGFRLPVGYSKVNFVDFDNKDSVEFLKAICEFLPVNLNQIKNQLPTFPALANWHALQMKNKAIDITSLFIRALWASLADKNKAFQRRFLERKNQFQTYIDQQKWDFLNAFDFHLDYKAMLTEEVELKFDLKLTDVPDEIPTGIYLELISRFNIEEAILSPEDQSLLYFPGHDEYLSTLFDNFGKLETKDIVEDEFPDTLPDVKFSTISDRVAPLPLVNTSSSSKLPNNDHDKRNRQQKRAGKRAELLTRNILRKEHDVVWISANSDQADVLKNDGVGYDMKYRRKGTVEWFFLEVKSVHSNSFVISLNEIRVALEKKDNYHLGLVRNEELNIITDFFTDENRISKFKEFLGSTSIRPTEFEVYFDMRNVPEEENLQGVDTTQII